MPDPKDLDYVPQPKDLVLDEEVTLAGRTTSGTRARLYSLLLQTREQARCWRIGKHTGPPGWVPVHVVRKPWAGGSSGTRRIRELRHDYGCDIESKPYETPDGETTRTTLYRLGGPEASAREPKPAPTAPHGRGRRPTPPADKPAHPTAARSARTPPDSSPLDRLEIWLVDGHPADLPAQVAASLTADVTPGRPHRLAPTLDVLGADDPREAYRQQLLGLYHRDELQRVLGGHRRVVLWREASTYDPLPLLEHALSRLGATIRHHAEAA